MDATGVMKYAPLRLELKVFCPVLRYGMRLIPGEFMDAQSIGHSVQHLYASVCIK